MMIAITSVADRKQQPPQNDGIKINGRLQQQYQSNSTSTRCNTGPGKSSPQQEAADVNLIKTNSISSQETVIARFERGQQLANGTEEANQKGTQAEDEAQPETQTQSARTKTSKTLKSLFIHFAGQHLNLFHSQSNSNNHQPATSSCETTPVKADGAESRQSNGGEAPPEAHSSARSPLPTSNNFLVSFAQKCFHLRFSSNSSSSASASAAATNSQQSIERNCHSCPVTPLKHQNQLLVGGADLESQNGTSCSSSSQAQTQVSDSERIASTKRMLGHHPSGNVTKKPQVRFVVESHDEADEGEEEVDEDEDEDEDEEEGDATQTKTKPNKRAFLNKTTNQISSETATSAIGKQRYFMINKHIKFKPAISSARVKFADRGVQTSKSSTTTATTTSNSKDSIKSPSSILLNDQNEFIENDEERAKLVEQLFSLPKELEGGAAQTTNEREPLNNNNKHSALGQQPMNSGQFREYGYRLIDYICEYLDTIRQRRVTPINIEPGYLKELIQPNAPERGESFSRIMHDFENHIMCGITHWQHPHFHAYFPAGNAYPSILADMLSDALGCVGFSWAASPAYTELEIIMLDWMGKMIGLPDEFLCLTSSGSSSSSEQDQATEGVAESSAKSSRGGGVIQGSASECVLVNMLAARHWAMDKLRKKYPNTQDGILLTKLIGYCSKEAHSCVEKAAMIGFIRMRALETDERHSLRGETLRRAMDLDIAQGLEPFIVCATLGTTSCVSFDNLRELGEVCRDHDNLWLHVDAAYAGSALICPEFKYLIDGIELATSINMNPNKWMLINFDCSLMWVKDRFKLTRAFVVDPLYLQHSFSDQAIDYRHWGIPLSRRFRALKLWFVIRNYGIEGLREYIRNHVRLAKKFELLIREDKRFMITNEVTLGLVCFRLVGSNALNQRLLSMLNASGKLHMVPASLNGRYVIRFCVCDQNAREEDIHYAYECISQMATELFELIKAGKERIRAISQQNTIDVSNISLHTQQSASADRLSGLEATGQNAPTGQEAAGPASGRPGLLRRSSTRRQQQQQQQQQQDSPAQNQEQQQVAELTTSQQANLSPAGGARSPKQVLTKQVSVREHALGAGAASQRSASATSHSQHTDTKDPLEDLEQEIPIDSLATIDGHDLDLEDELDEDELLADLDDLDLEAIDQLDQDEGGLSTTLGQDHHEQSQKHALSEQQLRSIINDSISPIQRGRLSRASHSVRSSSTRAGVTSGSAYANGGQQDQEADEAADEAADELVKLADKRNRMSLRYKREFFVRVVSDPRVYRASISGDINAHAASSTSSLGSQSIVAPHQQATLSSDSASAPNASASSSASKPTNGKPQGDESARAETNKTDQRH